MKFKPTVILATFVVAMGLLLLGASSHVQAQATVIFDTNNATKAIGIQNLSYNNQLWNVDFTDFLSARNVYGNFPGRFDFPGKDLADGAIVAVNNALNASVATGVGSETLSVVNKYVIGYASDNRNTYCEVVLYTYAQYISEPAQWELATDATEVCYAVPDNLTPTWADFTLVPAVQTVIFDESGTNAIGIENLDIGGELFDVSFTASVTAAQAYGPFPGEYDVAGVNGAISAVDAMTEALNDAGADTVGEGASSESFFVGYLSTDPLGLESVTHREAVISGAWDQNPISFTTPYNTGDKVWADFTESTAPADQFTIGGSVTGLVGSGLVLQNNGGDDETITGDGAFTFDTSLAAGSPYNVTVSTQPDGQLCSVENGSGVATDVDVTNVEVSCVDLVVSDVIAVATEGDTLGETTVLTVIERAAGVAINRSGTVAFGGQYRQDDVSTVAVFTQNGPVVTEGDELPDGTIVNDLNATGQVAISDGQNGEMVAFHGRAGDLSVFTQAALVAREGESLGGTLVHQIKPEGEVAINDFDLVAFHGKIQIGDGPFAEEFRAVFTSEGLVAQEGVKLGDSDTIPVTISEVGGVAINLFGVVAFHGQTVDGINDTNAVFTNEGLIAEEGQTLESTDILSSIDRHGGVAINLFGEVAFHGVTDAIKAVFTQYGPIVKEGDILPDGTIVDEINVSGGVAINFYGDVAFHGRTGEKKAVFTQYGLVAKVGDILDGGTTLSEIWETGGVAINPYDRQVAFHGTVDSTNDAVFVGLAPVPPASE